MSSGVEHYRDVPAHVVDAAAAKLERRFPGMWDTEDGPTAHEVVIAVMSAADTASPDPRDGRSAGSPAPATVATCPEWCRCDPARCDSSAPADLDSCTEASCAVCVSGCPAADCPHLPLLTEGDAFYVAHRRPRLDVVAHDARVAADTAAYDRQISGATA